MRAQEFNEWACKTGIRSAADMVRATGMSRNLAQEIYKAAAEGRDVEIKRSLALAMSAIAAGLKPWGEQEGDNDD